MPKSEKGVIWCDARSNATALCIEIKGIIAEDAAWLQKKKDFNPIKVAELDAVVKGANPTSNRGRKTCAYIFSQFLAESTLHLPIEKGSE